MSDLDWSDQNMIKLNGLGSASEANLASWTWKSLSAEVYAIDLP